MKRALSILCMGGLMFGGAAALAQHQPNHRLEKKDTVQQVTLEKRTGKDTLSTLEELDLSEAQQTEIDGIQTDMVDGLSEILTSDQMHQLATAQADGDDMRSVMRGLGLTSSQRSSVISLMRNTQSQIMNVLTPEQRAQIEEEMPRDR